MKSGPLAGIKVVEIAGIGPAPCAGMMLSDMGAEVIVVERKVGNLFPHDKDARKQMFFNRGKKSIAVDLKQPEGQAVVLKLLENADIFIEGFRPGVMERLGLGPDVCLNTNPQLVYGRMTGWGQTGPLAHTAGHDPNYIGLTGTLHYAGRKEHAPMTPLTVVGDMGGGTMLLVWGVLCGLTQAQRTGKGDVVDAAITDGTAYISSLLWLMHNSGQAQNQLGNGWVDGAAPWSQNYACADGKYVSVCTLEPQFYEEFVHRMELQENPVFAEQWNAEQWPKGKETLSNIFLTKTRDEWCELLEGTDACFAPVLDFTEAPNHPHNLARKTFLNIDGVVQPAPAPKFQSCEFSAGSLPQYGEHTDDVLSEMGIDAATLEQYRTAGIVA